MQVVQVVLGERLPGAEGAVPGRPGRRLTAAGSLVLRHDGARRSGICGSLPLSQHGGQPGVDVDGGGTHQARGDVSLTEQYQPGRRCRHEGV